MGKTVYCQVLFFQARECKNKKQKFAEDRLLILSFVGSSLYWFFLSNIGELKNIRIQISSPKTVRVPLHVLPQKMSVIIESSGHFIHYTKQSWICHHLYSKGTGSQTNVPDKYICCLQRLLASVV